MQQKATGTKDTVTSITLPWFLCIFISWLPLQTVLHVLDCFFNEGPVILFQAALAVFKLNEHTILSAENSEEIITLLKQKQYFFEELLQVRLNARCQPTVVLTFISQTAFKCFDQLPSTIKELRAAHKFKAIQKIEHSNRTAHVRDVTPFTTCIYLFLLTSHVEHQEYLTICSTTVSDKKIETLYDRFHSVASESMSLAQFQQVCFF